MSNLSRFVLCVLALNILVGCNDKKTTATMVDVEVVVMLGGSPLPNATVTLTPEGSVGAEAIGNGITDENGRAKMKACVGKNKVTLADAPPPEDTRGQDAESQAKLNQYQKSLKNRPIPPKYTVLVQSDASIEIKKDQKEYKIELQR